MEAVPAPGGYVPARGYLRAPPRATPPRATPPRATPLARPHPRPHVRAPPPSAPAPAPALLPALLPAPAPAPRAHAQSAGAPRDWRQHPRQEPDRPLPTSVLVTGYPPYTKAQDLAHVFCRFGDVRLNHEWITEAGACLEFGTAEQARAAVAASRQVNIYGAFLTVRPATLLTRPQRQPRRREQRVKQTSKGSSVDPASIPLEGPFQQQLEALLSRVQLSQSELARLAALYADIESALHDIWPGCRAYPFGSVTTGLGVKSSDADCYVALPPGLAAQAVPRARRALQQHPRLFAELLAIPRANTPIVKFLHLPTRVYCDLSFKTSLGSRNSKLISFLLYSDPRLIPMAVVVKYWARVHDLSGTGKLTNYALTMLIIFYLQQPPRSILPPVEWLQRDRADTHFVDYWNTGFMDDHGKLPRSPDASTIPELLGGFFEFYSKFDFDQFAVCPFVGRPIKKDDFRNRDLLPQEFALYKLNVTGGYSMPMRFMTPMCVQDPFEQCHNVASPITPRLAQDIQAFFKFAADHYEKEKPNACADFLKNILLHKPELPRVRSRCCRFRVRLPPSVLGHVAATQDWKTAVREVTFQIFETLLRTKLEVPEEERRREAKAKGKENTKPADKAAAKSVEKKTGLKKAKAEGTSEAGTAQTQAKTEAKGTKAEGKPDVEEKETIKPKAKESVASEENNTTSKEEKVTKPEGAVSSKPEDETTKPEDEATAKQEDKKSSPKKSKPEAAVAREGGIAKEKERYTARLSRAVWKRKRFPNRDAMHAKFPEREAIITDDILRLDPDELKIQLHVVLTFFSAPRGAFLDLKYVAGELDGFKEFGYFINCNFNNWFVLLFNPYCKEKFHNKTFPDMSAINYKDECTDTDSDTDSYEDERINPNKDHKRSLEKLTESHIDYAKLQSVIEKINKNNTNDVVKHDETDKNKSNTDKTLPDKKPVHKNDKDGNPSDKSPKKKNRSPRHRKRKESSQNSPAHADSRKTSTVANGQLP